MKKILLTIFIYLMLAFSGWALAHTLDRFDFKIDGFGLGPSGSSSGDKILMESGDAILLESGDNILLE